MVMVVVPVPVTWPPAAGMVSTVDPSAVWWMVMLPVSVSTGSTKVRTMLASTATPVVPFAGVDETRVGSTVSDAVVKFHVVVSRIPAKLELLTPQA